MSVSGLWAARLLKKLKANVFLFDDDYEKLTNIGINKCTILNNVNKDTIKKFDCIIVSPSIEKDNPVILLVKQYLM